MREGTTSRVMAADSPDGELNDFYSVSLECFAIILEYPTSSGWGLNRSCSHARSALTCTYDDLILFTRNMADSVATTLLPTIFFTQHPQQLGCMQMKRKLSCRCID
jgi:hypothetical protein